LRFLPKLQIIVFFTKSLCPRIFLFAEFEFYKKKNFDKKFCCKITSKRKVSSEYVKNA
jgi:hypothetical protein